MRLAVLISALTSAALAQAPPGYYGTVDTSSASALRATLHDVIDDHQWFPYTSGSTDTWDILEQADEDPLNPQRILDLYRNRSYAKAGGGNSNYNREHTWPNSYGFSNNSGTNYPYTDCHHLFLCDIGYNAARGSRPFRIGSSSWNEYTTNAYNGSGGGSGSYPGNSNWQTSNDGPNGGFEVWVDRRGDVARALFYMDVRYEGGSHGTTGVSEPDLVLTDNTSLINYSNGNASLAYMGRLSTLLQWHQQDPVDQREITRNNVIFGYQGNRNPFIDNPAWVDCLYGNQCGTPSTGREPEVWINELHYDNAGTDVGEFVELVGFAGERLDDWLLIAYDGATGTAYAHRLLSGTFPNQQNGRGALSFAFPGLQNGTDGVALVTPTGVVMQFLSYEGSFQATDGAAAGRTSVDIGVSESSTTPAGWSLRLSGTGSFYSQFAWQPPFPASAGAINSSQQVQ